MSLLNAVRDMDRLRQITQVLARHGFGELLNRMGLFTATATNVEGEKVKLERPQIGHRLRLALQELGPTFVKLGQILSTRADLLPEDVLAELRQLQDNVAPFSEQEVRQQIEAALGAKAETVFASFDWHPLASASIAQVHRATLRMEGSEQPLQVAAKIQRPGIIPTVQRDLDLLYLLARLVERTVPEARIYSPTGLVREFDEAINAELDFTVEAQNSVRFTRNFAGDHSIRFPGVFAQASARRVISLEYFDGLKVTDAVRAGASGQWIAENAVRIILKMVFEDGFFHADPHPGNVLILPRPQGGSRYAADQQLTIGLLDLGLVGRLSPELRDRALDLLGAAARNDVDAIAEAMLTIGRPRDKLDSEAFRRYIRQVADRHLGKPLKDVQATAVIGDIVSGAVKFQIEIPTELTMMLRALMTIEGVGKEIYPELDLLAVAKPYLTKMLWQRFHPLKVGGELLRGAERLGNLARHLPYQIQEILEDVRQGRLELRVHDPQRTGATERLGRRIRAAIVFAALLGSGLAATMHDRSDRLGWALMIVAGLWLLGHLFMDRRLRRS